MTEFQLSDAKKGEKLKILRIDGGEHIKKELKKEGIDVGSVVEVISKGVDVGHTGALIVEVKNREIVIPRGIALKIEIGDKSLFDLKPDEIRKISGFTLDKNSIEALKKLGIEYGVDVKLKDYLDKAYIFKINDKDIELGIGEAAKILVNENGNIVQAPFCNEGEICNCIGGSEFLDKIEKKLEIKDVIGKKITKISEKPCEASEKGVKGESMTLKINDDKVITIGKGKAEKIWVEFYI
ncbi:FeoA domain-containing protein [Methanothermococcus sp.]|uniref:FeoA domain-containing protein n=1 Tax=Methanothermococcus sp. TaxID=2614238 RepID=UPI0025D60D78|nr:FeoA family protein [Methanothermococcus sp.]